MQNFFINFVLDSRRADERGFLYCEEISLIDPQLLLKDLAVKKFYAINGGYCFVADQHIWNSYSNVPYDPRRAYCQIDDVNLAYLFLENVANQLADDHPVDGLFLEMVTIKITPASKDRLKISATTATGAPLYKEIVVPAATFYRELCKATESFISFAKVVVSLLDSDYLADNKKATSALRRNLNLARWQTASEKLRELVQQRYG